MEQGNRDTGWNSRGRKERAMGRETGQRGRERERERDGMLTEESFS